MKVSFTPLFTSPLMEVQLDFDLEKLTEFVSHVRKKDQNGIQHTNMGGYHSNDQLHIEENIHEEFIGLVVSIVSPGQCAVVIYEPTGFLNTIFPFLTEPSCFI